MTPCDHCGFSDTSMEYLQYFIAGYCVQASAGICVIKSNIMSFIKKVSIDLSSCVLEINLLKIIWVFLKMVKSSD